MYGLAALAKMAVSLRLDGCQFVCTTLLPIRLFPLPFPASQFGHIFFSSVQPSRPPQLPRQPERTEKIIGSQHYITLFQPFHFIRIQLHYRKLSQSPQYYIFVLYVQHTCTILDRSTCDCATSPRRRGVQGHTILSLSSAPAQLRSQSSTCRGAMLRRHQFS